MDKPSPVLQTANKTDLTQYKELFKGVIKVSVVAFILYVVYMFIALYMKMQSSSPVLIRNIQKTNKEVRIKSSTLPLSYVDDGMTWSFVMWLYVDDFTLNQGRAKNILDWGTNNVNIGFASDVNDMVIRIGTIPNKNATEPMVEEVRIKNIPLQKWFNATIILDNRNVDCFLDGILVESRRLERVPRYVTDDLVLFNNKGFEGKAGYIQYMNYRIPQYGITHFTQMRKRFDNTSIIYSLYQPIFFTFVYGAKMFLMTLLIVFNRFFKVLHILTIDTIQTLWGHIVFAYSYLISFINKMVSM
jgi:hypothetical protein